MFKAQKVLLLQKIQSNPFLKNVMLISGSTVISQLVVLCIYPVVSRLYNVADFGAFQMAQSFLSFMIIVGALRYDNAILLPKSDDEALSVWQLTFVVNCAFFLLFGLVIGISYLINIPLGQILGIGKNIFYLPFIFFGAVLYQGLVFLNLRIKEFSTIGKTKIFQAIGNSSTQVSFGLLFNGPFGLFLGDFVGRSAGIYNLLTKSLAIWKIRLFKLNKVEIKKMAIRYKDFAIYNTPGAILNTAGFTLPALFIGKVYGLEMLGLFAIVDRVYAAPSVLIGQSVSQVFMTEAASLVNVDMHKLKHNYLLLIKKLSLIFIVPTIVILLFGPWIFQIVFGHQWRQAGVFASILSIMQFAGFVVWPLIPTLLILEKQKVQLLWEISRVILIILAFVFCYIFHLSILLAISAYGIIMLIFYIIHVFISLYNLNKRINA